MITRFKRSAIADCSSSSVRSAAFNLPIVGRLMYPSEPMRTGPLDTSSASTTVIWSTSPAPKRKVASEAVGLDNDSAGWAYTPIAASMRAIANQQLRLAIGLPHQLQRCRRLTNGHGKLLNLKIQVIHAPSQYTQRGFHIGLRFLLNQA